MARELLKGNVAIAEAAIRAGCQAYFGYPITPQTELLEHMSQRMPELGRVFLQAESELAAINMVYGAACAGVRAMTSSSSPGISLMQEGFSYIACSEVPAVVIDVMRGGPGLGNIQPSQSDYNQIVKTAGHGDFRPIVLAPSTIQEAIDLTMLAFDLADQYRTLVILALDGALGQLMEPAILPPMQPVREKRPAWALTGAKGRSKQIITSLYLSADVLAKVNERLQAKLAEIQEAERRFQELFLEDAQLVIVAFGTAARVAQTAVKRMRDSGVPVGLFRPITLWPFPYDELGRLTDRAHAFLVVEMNAGQMLSDVQLAVGRGTQTEFVGRPGGVIPLTEDILEKACALWRQIEVVSQHL
jgi:2-oxoglutarate ferredoxin oxidoreductase subunit alpha